MGLHREVDADADNILLGAGYSHRHWHTFTGDVLWLPDAQHRRGGPTLGHGGSQVGSVNRQDCDEGVRIAPAEFNEAVEGRDRLI